MAGNPDEEGVMPHVDLLAVWENRDGEVRRKMYSYSASELSGNLQGPPRIREQGSAQSLEIMGQTGIRANFVEMEKGGEADEGGDGSASPEDGRVS